MRCIPALSLLAAAAASLPAQSNTIPGLGSRLFDVSALAAFGRLGTFPNGRNGLAAQVTVCNNGTVPVNWFAAMNADHPMYAFLLCRESGGRFVQISDRSFVKHGFASINGDCGGCIPPPLGGAQLGVNCNDTYGAGLDADRFDLGPPGEVDPWLVLWNQVGSHFDRGEPAVLPPASNDGQRSLTQAMVDAMDGVKHRIEVDDSDLVVPGASFYVAGRVLARGEAESTREDNGLSRRVTPAWNGSSWAFGQPAGTALTGTPLNQWTGATLRSGSNGSSDGRVWVGVKVSQLPTGRWHYEYAFHNRDNGRGIAGIHIGKCPTAQISGQGFRDIDRSVFNDWSVAASGTEVTALAGAGNALEWNTIYDLWFDSDAAPAGAPLLLDEARAGAGALQFTVLDVPSPVRLGNETIGPGCGAPAPALAAIGTPALANIPNASFALRVAAHAATGVVVAAATAAANQALGNGCTQWFGGVSQTIGFAVTDAAGVMTTAAPVPNLPALEGLDLFFQAAELYAGGPLFGQVNLTNGLRVRIGNSRTGCP